MKIICDTNIWYNIANQNISKEKIEGLELVLTLNSLLEFGSTDLLFRRPLFVKEALKMALSLSSSIEMRFPFDVISEVLVDGFKTDFAVPNKMLEESRIFSRMKDIDIYRRICEEMKYSIASKRIEIQGVCDHINNVLLPPIRQNLNDKNMRQQHAQADNRNGIVEYFMFLLKLKNPEITFNENFPAIDLITFLITCTGTFYKDLELSTNRNFKINDWYDMFNLAYMNNDSLYWTFDKPWIQIINQAGYGNRLFSL